MRKNTTAGVLFWTPAPVRTSRTSSVVSEDAWEDEDEDQAEKKDDFVSQMDENGIIGLSEVLKDVELGESCNPNLYPGPLTTEEAESSGHERDTPEELSYNLGQRLSHAESPREDVQSPCGSLSIYHFISSTFSLLQTFNFQVLVRVCLKEHLTCFACLSSLTSNYLCLLNLRLILSFIGSWQTNFFSCNTATYWTGV